MSEIKIIPFQLSELKPYARNNKKHPAEQVQKIAQSISEYGFNNPILVENDGTIINGHGRYLAAKDLEGNLEPAIDKKTNECVSLQIQLEEQTKNLEKTKNSFPQMAVEIEAKIKELKSNIAGIQNIITSLSQINEGLIPAIVVTGLTEDQIKAYRIMDNRSAESEYDLEAIRLELEELESHLFDLKLTGFDTKEINKIMNVAVLDPNDLKDVAPDEASKIKTDIKKGDLFQLGDHRLICGDSTDPPTYERLLAGKKANLMPTDPPYNVAYEDKFKFLTGKRGSTKRDSSQIQNDKMETGSFYTFLKNFYSAAYQNLAPGAAIYIFHSETEGLNFRAAMQDAGFKFSETLVWVKQSFVIGRADYHYQHEPILYGWKEGAAHFFIYDRSQGTVIDYAGQVKPKDLSKAELVELCKKLLEQQVTEPTTVIHCDRPAISEDHPTQKPIKLVGRLILNSSKQGDIVLEPFGGSGTCVIACEQLKRPCYCIELDEKYCQVIINRWEKLTGQKAVKLN